MHRIERPAVFIDRFVVASIFDLLLCGVVAVHAQALQLAQHKLVPIAAMSFDVIDYRGRRHHAALQAKFAQRMFLQLELAAIKPVGPLVKMQPSPLSHHA